MSNFTVSARKYRPGTFETVVGQQHVTQTLKNAILSDRLGHAFLFCGPRGVGKTTCARILAKALNCTSLGADGEPCGACDACNTFSKQQSFNIYELDAASNNSVEDIRNLTDQVRFAPQSGRYKIYIIDEVHMLSQAAFNAFLKTLEEPPSYAIFILATTERHKILPTILSRCQVFDFHRISVAGIIDHLKAICAKEGIQAEDEALYVIAQKADGALRDALSIFDRVTGFAAGQTLTYKDIIENLNVLDHEYYFQVMNTAMQQDIPGMLMLFDEILKKGFDAQNFLNGLSEHLRNLLVCKDASTLKLLEVSEGVAERYQAQGRDIGMSYLLSALNLVNSADVNFKASKNQRLHVELAMMKLCHLNNAIKLAQNGSPSANSGTSPVAEEKKKPDSVGAQNIAPTNPVPQQNTNPTTGIGQAQNIAPNADDPATQGPATDPPAVMEPVPQHKLIAQEGPALQNPSPSPAGAVKLPNGNGNGFSLNRDKIKAAALQRVQKNSTEEKPAEEVFEAVRPELFEQVWKKYIHSLAARGKTNLHSMADDLEVKYLETGEVEVIAHNDSLRTQLELDRNALTDIMQENHCTGVRVTFKMQDIPEEELNRPMMTVDRERFRLMAEENPALNDFQQKLGLRID